MTPASTSASDRQSGSATAEFESLKRSVARVLGPIKPADNQTRAPREFLFTARGAVDSDKLPPPHLIYFLLVELMGYKDLGRFEKLAWSIPIDFNGTAFLIEHRKFGVGVFCGASDHEFQTAKRIAILIGKAVKAAQPYFKWKADQAVAASQFNVINNSSNLFGRYEYLRGIYREAYAEAERRKDETVVTRTSPNATTITVPYYSLSQNARWLATTVIEAFFGWTEHVFIHLAILQGRIGTGGEFSELAGAEWNVKFRQALDLQDTTTKVYYDDLMIIRRQLRNFMAHGAFGKEGEALYFHSRAGAVPVVVDYLGKRPKFSLTPELGFDDQKALETIESFIEFLWSGDRKPARIYIQESDLPLIMTMARDGTYRRAMTSKKAMKPFVRHLSEQSDNAANMDW